MAERVYVEQDPGREAGIFFALKNRGANHPYREVRKSS